MPTSKEEKLAGWVSVTEVTGFFLEPSLVDWKIRVGTKEAKRISNIATKFGTKIHGLCEDWFRNGSYKLKKSDDIEVHNGMKAWDEFVAQYVPKIESMEIEAKSESLKVVGHADIIAEIRGEKILIDIKSSSRLSSKYWLQVHAYAYLLGIKPNLGILLLDKNLGVCRLEKMVYDESYVEVFLGLLKAYRYFNTANGGESEATNGSESDSSTHRSIPSRQEVAIPEIRVDRVKRDW
jgi:hypothetical protein